MEPAEPAVICVDIGGTKTKVARFLQGRLSECHHGPTPQDPRQAVEMLTEQIERARQAALLRGIGIGCPGPLDPARGVILSPPNLPRWEGVELARQLASRFGTEVRIDNDANLGALGEACHGAGRDFRTVFYLTISTGLGAGFVIDGEVHHGRAALAGEIWAFRPGAFTGDAGQWNLNDLCSGNGMVKRAGQAIADGRGTAIPHGEVATHTILRAWRDGDELAGELVDQARRALAAAVAFVAHGLAPDVFVIGGGLCTDPSWFLEPLRKRFRDNVGIAALRDTPILAAGLGDSAVLFGAAAQFGR